MTMDEKIEQLAKDLKLIKELQASDIYTANYQEARALFSLGYRKESETAREILGEVSKHYGGAWLVELYKKYGVDLGE